MKVAGWVIVVVLVAGCTDSRGSDGNESVATRASQAPAAAPNSGFGSIRVTVVTTEIEPVADAEVAVADTDRAAYTDAAGVAVFNDLEPAQYTVIAAKAGYQTVQEKGRLVDVLAGEVAEARLTLNPILLVSANNSYYRTVDFNGFIACSFEGKTIGYTSYCGRGLQVQGQDVGRDPNDNSTHPWQIDGPQVQGVVLEARWTPSFAALGSELRIRSSSTYSCDAYHCSPGGAFQEATGASPLRAERVEGTKQNFSKLLGTDASKFPYKVWSEARAYCSPSCNINILVQQRYEMHATAFYGREPEPGFTALPKG
ncbi:MAG TPA: carboxypeptidase-like regulatory domain-containing protein [Candidatus Thermoplasmatota archaeon]|nr:carboxypeptidase-like regulatory domain-containing protein [Candidatus Thermoplasmatota archaeon]